MIGLSHDRLGRVVDHVELSIKAVAGLRYLVLVPLFAEAQDLGVVTHELVRLFGETDVLSEVKEVVPVHPAIIAILQIAAIGHGQRAELPPMLTPNQVSILRPGCKGVPNFLGAVVVQLPADARHQYLAEQGCAEYLLFVGLVELGVQVVGDVITRKERYAIAKTDTERQVADIADNGDSEPGHHDVEGIGGGALGLATPDLNVRLLHQAGVLVIFEFFGGTGLALGLCLPAFFDVGRSRCFNIHDPFLDCMWVTKDSAMSVLRLAENPMAG